MDSLADHLLSMFPIRYKGKQFLIQISFYANFNKYLF